MKRYLFSLMSAALLLAAASCSSEADGPAPGADDGTVTFTLALPAGIGSRAYSDGLTATKLTYAVYDHNATTVKAIIHETVEPFGGGLTGTVSFKLVTGRTYDILFWADSYGTAASPYTFDPDAQTITVSYAGATANDEARDAFFAARKELHVTGPVDETITLTRPFAQVNFGTDDLAEPAVQDLADLKASVATTAYTKLNLLTGEASEPAAVTFGFDPFPTTESFPYEPTKYQYVAMNYLLVPADKETLDALTLTVQAAGTDFNTVAVPNAPVQRNYRTNIYGSLLTSTALFNIVIDSIYSDMYNLSYTEVKLMNAAANGGTVVLEEDVDLSNIIAVASGKDMVINLNGHNITTTGESVFEVSGNLTINGEGTVTGTSGCDATVVTAFTGSTVTINGGTYTVGVDANGLGNSCIYCYGGDVTINSGTFSTAAMYNNKYYVLNLNNTQKGTITCYGGTFIGQNPAGGDDAVQPTSFVADGYSTISVQTSDGVTAYTVVPSAVKQTATTTVDGNSWTYLLVQDNGQTIDGNGTILWLDSATEAAVYSTGGTIQNLNMINSNGGGSVIYVNLTQDLHLENCNLTVPGTAIMGYGNGHTVYSNNIQLGVTRYADDNNINWAFPEGNLNWQNYPFPYNDLINGN